MANQIFHHLRTFIRACVENLQKKKNIDAYYFFFN
ncbi:hypothetical protein predicted by Glimmer/Critica [Salmonella enterica subsp. enterica serovar Weltevreden str. 2007-60-3289-1]|nr:hypothetical protein SE451236_19150 [Salmonella enterica subsp. enterica serovar 4,[5],12:i:- str. 08-1736]EQM35933.1 hypothetical protein B571_25345 [Salmonella enterica subsp. enterica serovar Typhimurium str. STm1]EQM51924.1 hypothetical protein B576_24555 [Salmonella enterica subsp. enterica serovar Typhimurium str. STm8]EQM55646.1 hypothetical protein B577_25130 [Salmonella enterica subsp. enterica serovar Typhimurium str. STm9]EQM56229.1 hypothetical protein B573_24425 [Salmonella ente